jgi:protein-S-isoprenylcysteine O-methyltransferase Ste14
MFLYYLFRWRTLSQSLLTLGKASCAAVIIVGLVYAINPNYLSTRAAGFSDAFSVAFTGSNVEDVSANVRIYETLTAWTYIQKNPLLGNGTLSNQWEGGSQGTLGYFYPDDIGVIGAVFTVGVVGLLLFMAQFWFAIWAVFKLPGRSRG